MGSYRQPGDFVEVEPGVEIYYEERGTGTPILIVPGWTFTTEVFVHQLEQLSEKYRVIVIDPRSQGRSSITMHGNDYTTHAADLAKVIKALGFDPEDIPVMFGEKELKVTQWGTLVTNFHTKMTSMDGVFAAGDIVRGASLVVWAVRDGRDAAMAMHRYIQKKTGEGETAPLAAE